MQAETLKTKLRRAKTMAKNGHPDFKNSHPDEVRDANNKIYTKLEKRVKEQFDRHIENTKMHRDKLNGT